MSAGKSPSPNCPQFLGDVGLPERVDSFGLFEQPAACAELLRWAGLREARQVDYHARRERDIERLADLVEAHLDTRKLRELCGL